jgi:hypothetical protein
VRFEVFTAMRMVMFFWVLAPCRFTYQRVYTAPKIQKNIIEIDFD